MRWRVVIELTRGDGAVHAREVATGSDDSAGSAVKPLGLTLAVSALQKATPPEGRQGEAVELAVRDCRCARASVQTLPLQHYIAAHAHACC